MLTSSFQHVILSRV